MRSLANRIAQISGFTQSLDFKYFRELQIWMPTRDWKGGIIMQVLEVTWFCFMY